MRTFCLTIWVLASMSGLTATGASAEALFTSEEVGATIQGTVETSLIWTVTGSQATCTEPSFAGVTEAAESETLRVVPTYKGCTAFGLPATMSNENCVFVIFSDGTLAIEPVAPKASCQFVIAATSIFGKCKAVIKNQSLTGAVTFGSASEGVQATFGATGVAAEVTESTGVCPLTIGSHKNATYSGKLFLSAKGSWLRWHAPSNRFVAGTAGARIVETTLKTHVFDIGAFQIECKLTTFEGTTEAVESGTMRVTPSYSQCSNAFYAISLVNENCQFVFHATGGMDIQAVSLEKPCQFKLTISQGPLVCKLIIPAQKLEGVGYVNGELDLRVPLNVSNFAEVTESKGGCWMSVGERTVGYTAESTLQAEGSTLQWAA